MTNDPRRKFSKSEREAIYMAADGKSEISGQELPPDWHADHEKPWSKGGATDIGNAQATTPEENLTKSDHWQEPRNRYSWQDQFVQHYRMTAQRDYLLAALPGSGKTRAACRVGREFRDTFQDSKVIVLTPSSHLRRQWRKVAASHNIHLRSKEFSGSLVDFDGVVTTYSAVEFNPMLFKRICSKHPCFVIFDEIHHAGESQRWGAAINLAFENAERRLHLSGTPFKSDGQKIAFLRVDADNRYCVDFTYDYPTALRDNILRIASFHRYSSQVSVAVNAQTYTWHTDDDLSETDAARRLRGLVLNDVVINGLLLEAKHTLELLRNDKPDAGALVACIDIEHAKRVAAIIAKIEGEPPDIATSDDENASDTIDRFERSKRKWLVSVKMVSEGIDIPRLMVLAFLTNTTTELFFRQIVARVLRNQNTEFDTEAHVFIPDVKPLTDYAATIEQFQTQVIAEDNDHPPTAGRTPQQRSEFQVLSATSPEFAGLTTRGVEHGLPSAEQIKALAEQFNVPPSKVAGILSATANTPNNPTRTPNEDREAQCDALRTAINKLANRIANVVGMPYRDVHLKYLKTFDGTRQRQMSIAQLKAKHEWLLKWLTNPTPTPPN